MIVFTIPLFVLLLISNRHIYGYPSTSLHDAITNHGHGFKVLQRPQLTNNDRYDITSNINNEDRSLLTYMYYLHKRLIDF